MDGEVAGVMNCKMAAKMGREVQGMVREVRWDEMSLYGVMTDLFPTRRGACAHPRFQSVRLERGGREGHLRIPRRERCHLVVSNDSG